MLRVLVILLCGAMLGCASDDPYGSKGGCPGTSQTSPQAPDFSIEVDHEQPTSPERPVVTQHEGAVTVTDVGDAGLELEGEDLQATFKGMHPDVESGTTLWADLSQTNSTQDPDVFRDDHSHSIRVSEDGPWLAEDQRLDLPATSEKRKFLGVGVTFDPLCETEDECFTLQRYSVTIHGDTDLTLTPATRGHVMIDGIEYQVWLQVADHYAFRSQAKCNRADSFEHNPETVLRGRAVDYEALLP